MTSTNILFDDIFDNTHSELSLQQQIEEFQITYQSNVEITSINNQIEQDSYNQEEFNEFDISSSSILDESILEESTLNESVLTNEQIDKFKKIYSKDKIEDIEDNNNSIQNIKKNLDKKDEEAQYKKLQTIICCNEKCLNLISHEHAIANYQKFQNLSNNQKDMFLLGILSATTRKAITTDGQKRNRLDNNYIFEGIKICNEAFLIIYGIGEKYWKNIRSHFIEQGINSRIHKLTGKTSNFAISFEIVLEIITFIINYANIHGLPSPGIYNLIILNYYTIYNIIK